MFTRSIRWRFTLWLAFLLVVILSGFGITAFHLARNDRLRLIDEDLQALSVQVAVAVPPNASADAVRPRENVPGFTDGAAYFIVWLPDGKVQARSRSAPDDLPMPALSEKPHGGRTRGVTREFVRFNQSGRCFLVGRPIAAELAALRQFAWLLVGAGATVTAIGLGGGWLLASRALRPVDAISSAATRIAEGNLAERIDLTETDSELGRLAAVLNSAFARLEAAFARQRQFTADASHELRTPLTVMISEAQTTLARERTAPEYRETVEACLETAQQMRRLTESLLDLARFEDAPEMRARECVDLARIARNCADIVRPLATARKITIECQLLPGVVSGDTSRLEQVITNLLANAVHHSPAGGVIALETSTEADSVVARVRDQGAGIAADDLPHIFERFYRADTSRSHSEGRAGLGLAICKAICEAHGGTVTAESQLGSGSTFTLQLPAA